MSISSLRERKKFATRASLADAAFEIVRDLGPEHLTAEAVAERAGVSRRTFFNYFPSIDAAVAHSVETLLTDLTEALEKRPADESVWDTIPVILTGPEGRAILERVAVLGATRESSPQCRHLAQDHLEAFVEWLTGWVATRLPAVDELYAASLAAAVAAVAEASLRLWVTRNGGAVTDAAVADYRGLLAEALDLLRAGFERND